MASGLLEPLQGVSSGGSRAQAMGLYHLGMVLLCVCRWPSSDLTRRQGSVTVLGGGQFRRSLNWVFNIRAIVLEKGGHSEESSNGIKALLGLQSSANL